MRLWLRLFTVVTACLILSLCNDCSSPANIRSMFGSHMQCIKNTVTSNYSVFEKEIKEHNRAAIKSCFAQTIEEGNKRDRCVLALSDLENKAWDRNGPLRDCSICRTFASGAIKALLSTPADEQKCVRLEIAKAVILEANYCLRKKISNFPGMPEFPDFEEGSYAFRDDVVNSISDYILIYSRLAFCNDRKPERADATRRCLQNPFDGYFAKHCNILKDCASRIPPICKVQIAELRAATCSCIEDTRLDIKRRLGSISQAIKNVVDGNDRGAASIGGGSKVDNCVSNIKSLVRTQVNDWVDVIDGALGKCLKNRPAGQTLGLDSLINVGCRKVIADTTGTAHIQLRTGFDFINNLIGAMVSRSERFCGGIHCT